MFRYFIIFCISYFSFLLTNTAVAEHRIGSVARVKGQETTVIHGVGIVTGLSGRGDKADFGQTSRALGSLMSLNGQGGATPKELGASRNTALVRVTVTIPPEGARSGDELDCYVTAIGSTTSIEGGRLDLTPLIGPIPTLEAGYAPTYGFATGPITIENTTSKTVGKITKGCRLTDDFRTPYIDSKTGNLTLVLDQPFSTWQMAHDVANTINTSVAGGEEIAIAIDSKNIVVRVPKYELANPVKWVADVLGTKIFPSPGPVPTVLINEAAGIVIVDESVEVDPVSLTVRGIMIQTAPGPPQPAPERFVPLDIQRTFDQTMPNMKLKAVQDSLNAIKVPNETIIAIIKELYRMGKIHGQVIYTQ